MNADEIRKTNKICQTQAAQETLSEGAQEAGLFSLECSMLTEIAAQVAELNDKLKVILNPPLMYDTSKIDPVVFPELPQPITMMMNPPRATLRDKFAMAALQGLMMSNWEDCPYPTGYAEEAYKMADSMMEARK